MWLVGCNLVLLTLTSFGSLDRGLRLRGVRSGCACRLVGAQLGFGFRDITRSPLETLPRAYELRLRYFQSSLGPS
jgi:hypothetical protein